MARNALIGITLLLFVGGTAFAEGGYKVEAKDTVVVDPNDACINCHSSVSPGIVQSWLNSEHAVSKISCAACHTGMEGDPSGKDHFGTTVTAVPSPKYCQSCHPAEVAQNTRSKHAWTAFIGNYKPYYLKAKSMGLNPLSQETAKQLDPDMLSKTAVTPLFPDSGILKMTGLLDNPDYTHNNVTLGCAQCHGTFITVNEDGSLNGWPNTGVGRVNPDESLGSCSSCHTRHSFSVGEARKPDTCGQCHLGPDHPQHEIYVESKHGNIYAARGEDWNWDAPSGEWGTDDIEAPTCATCHMSGFNGAQATTHDVGERLYWELQPKVSVPQWRNADQVDDIVTQRISDVELAEAGRNNMRSICTQCHVSSWVDGYFAKFDNVVSDYNILWEYVDGLLASAYEDGLISKDNPIDEMPEIYHYLIWHHSGRRWRMGASMMGPDWTHWNGAIDTIMVKLGAMISDLEMRRKLQEMASE